MALRSALLRPISRSSPMSSLDRVFISGHSLGALPSTEEHGAMTSSGEGSTLPPKIGRSVFVPVDASPHSKNVRPVDTISLILENS